MEKFGRALPTVFQCAVLEHRRLVPNHDVADLAFLSPLAMEHGMIPNSVAVFIEQVVRFARFVTSGECLSMNAEAELPQTKDAEGMYTVLSRTLTLLDALPSAETSWLTQYTSTFQDLAAAAGQIFHWAVELNSEDERRLVWTPAPTKWTETTSTKSTHGFDICGSIQRFRKSRRCMNGHCGTCIADLCAAGDE